MPGQVVSDEENKNGKCSQLLRIKVEHIRWFVEWWQILNVHTDFKCMKPVDIETSLNGTNLWSKVMSDTDDGIAWFNVGINSKSKVNQVLFVPKFRETFHK